MKDFVSRWIHVTVLMALLLTAGVIFVPSFPWGGLMFLTGVGSAAFWIRRRCFPRSAAQVIWDVGAEPVRVVVNPRVTR